MAGLGRNVAAAQAFARFGLGGRPGDDVPARPISWLFAQLQMPDPTPTDHQPTTAESLDLLARAFAPGSGLALKSELFARIADRFAADAQAFLVNAVTTQAPFRERLVWFWANHLAIMAGSLPTVATAGSYVREAIRPNVMGRYADLLIAAILHPAMQYSLDNDLSVGPDSPFALKYRSVGVDLGINENLARETLELYSVGVGAGYVQADVDALAFLLTGCKVNTTDPPYGFAYLPDRAQPGVQTVMGNRYPASLEGVHAVLRWLGTHPATYRRLATKLVTHFTADIPADGDVAEIAGILSASGGDLSRAAAGLVALRNAWVPSTKFRRPLEYLVAALRGLGATREMVPDIAKIGHLLGEALWMPPFPNGWSDLAADWLGPACMMVRGNWASTYASLNPNATPSGFVAAAIGPMLSRATAIAADGLTGAHDQLALLLFSPEFQRR